MPLFARRHQCPACGRNSVRVEMNWLWLCRSCRANGVVSAGHILDLGLRGNQRSGSHEQYVPAQPVAAQLQPVAAQNDPHGPDKLAPLLENQAASERFNEAVFRFFYAFTFTSFEIDDPEVREADALYARTTGADDPSYMLRGTVSRNGWLWRCAEEQENADALVEETKHCVARYGTAEPRSLILELTAQEISDDALERRLYPDRETGHASLLGGWMLNYSMFVAWHHPALLGLHPPGLLPDSFHFGVALRDAEIAYNLAGASPR